MNQKFINLTAHTINEMTTGTKIPPSGQIARVKQSTVKSAEHAHCPIYTSEFGDVEGLPDPVEGIIYIVSALTLNGVAASRVDVVSPGNIQRDENKQPLGCVGFRAQ